MIVAANKWLGEHLLLLVLMQARSALRWFHVWNYDPLSGCHMKNCFHWFLLPCIDDIFMILGSFVWRVGYDLEIPIGSVILPTIHVACYRRSHGQTMISIVLAFSSCGRIHLENLRRHCMVYLFGGEAWANFGN